ncbi:Serine/threonine-protein phosphatase PP1 isozyme 7 [Tritrichomonas foetus]|uniref:Serine/threonine-protein phosphatase n=1 Tax=Tritrichomonas foetus TaxID=1144522 RepID=A0A1J4IZJ4_9EUKA|nr:Serine/threonine-protein phosphatase PP1 isozyme 7 [Tritrichomonas foetus]|eukprot:OHS92768.1 Serine/threonine-protein phosphatase PP1 isozyme 7 [Tritrichomonas foetus]
MKSRDANYHSLFNYFSALFSVDTSEYVSKRKPLRLPLIPLNILTALLEDATEILKKEETIVHEVSPLIIVGDIHGQILDLFRILKKFGSPQNSKYLFLGDFVDRGQFSFETILLILVMKILWPNNVIILRGNHEFDEIYQNGGFNLEIEEAYPNENVGDLFQSCFSYIPIAAIIDEYLICVHGGIGPSIKDIHVMKTIEKPVTSFVNDIVAEMLWSDPTEYLMNFQPSSRGSGYLFGDNAFTNFMKASNLEVMVRGHQCVESGVVSIWEDTCYTVFSASNYCGVSNNKAGILKVSPLKKIETEIFEPISQFKRSEAIFIDSKNDHKLEYPDPKGLPLIAKGREITRAKGRISSLRISKRALGNISKFDSPLNLANPHSSRLTPMNSHQSFNTLPYKKTPRTVSFA